jgi:hypothetical protein
MGVIELAVELSRSSSSAMGVKMLDHLFLALTCPKVTLA